MWLGLRLRCHLFGLLICLMLTPPVWGQQRPSAEELDLLPTSQVFLETLKPSYQRATDILRVKASQGAAAALPAARQLVVDEPLFGPAIEIYIEVVAELMRGQGALVAQEAVTFFETRAGSQKATEAALSWYGASLAYGLTHEWEAQLASARRAVDLRVEYWHCYQVFSEVHSRVGRVDEGREDLRHRISSAPEGERRGLLWLSLAFLQADSHVGRFQSREAGEEALKRLRPGRGLENTHSLLGNLAWARGEPRAALPHYQRAVAIFHLSGNLRSEARTLGGVGLAYGELGQPRIAMRYLRQAVSLHRMLGNRSSEGIALGNLANQYGALGDYRRAIGLSEVALAIHREVGNKGPECSVLNSLGRFLVDVGELDAGRAWTQEALTLTQSLGRRRSEALAWQTLALADQQAGKRFDARQKFEHALEVHRDAGDQKGETETLLLLGRLHLELGAYAPAVSLFKQVLSRNQDIGDRRFDAMVRHSMALVLAHSGKRSEAYRAFQEALQLEQASEDKAGELETRLEFARFLGASGFASEALDHSRLAITIQENLEGELPDARWRASYFSRSASIYALHIHLLLKQADLASEEQPSQALLKETFELGEKARSAGLQVRWQMRGAELARGAPESIAAEVRLLEEKLNVLRMLLRDPPKQPPDILVKYLEQRLQSEKDWYGRTGAVPGQLLLELETAQRSLQAGNLSPSIQARLLQDLYVLTQADLHQSYRQIAEVSPMFRAATAPTFDSASNIQSMLEPDTAMVAYLLGTEESFAWVVSRARIELIRLPAEKVIVAKINPLLAQLRRPDSLLSELIANSREAYRLLLAPLKSLIPSGTRLVFIPDGVLSALPFEALVQTDGESGVPSGGMHRIPPYLIVNHSVEYAPSATAWAHAVPHDGRNILARPLLAVGDPLYPQSHCDGSQKVVASQNVPGNELRPAPLTRAATLGECWESLPYSGEELNAMERLRSRDGARDDVFLRQAGATETRVHALPLERFGILHFAVHGVVDVDRPLRSAVVLAQNQDAGAGHGALPFSDPHDGYLELEELSSLQLEADLVMLSACETAIGRIRPGNGAESLAQAFLLAGARNVVATLWRVSDRVSAHFIRRFYEAVHNQSLAEALRTARLAFIRGDEDERGQFWALLSRPTISYVHPYFWAGYIQLRGELKSPMPAVLGLSGIQSQ